MFATMRQFVALYTAEEMEERSANGLFSNTPIDNDIVLRSPALQENCPPEDVAQARLVKTRSHKLCLAQ